MTGDVRQGKDSNFTERTHFYTLLPNGPLFDKFAENPGCGAVYMLNIIISSAADLFIWAE